MDRISNSVGRYGVNKLGDVFTVQVLLNRHMLPPARLLKVDHFAGCKTIAAIMAFQHRLGLAKCDGLVTPAGKTFNALCSLPKSVPITEHYFAAFNNFSRALGHSITDIGYQAKTSVRHVASYFSNHSPQIRTHLRFHVLPQPNSIAWGAKVPPEFKARVIEISKELGINPDYLMACMAFESCETFRADIPNKAGSGAVGLIQFMPGTAEWMNTTTSELAGLTPVKQLDYVRQYFISYKGKLNTLEDIYMVILWPRAIGKDPEEAIFKSGTKVYNQNKGFDKDHDGEITPKECTAAVYAAYMKGLCKENFG